MNTIRERGTRLLTFAKLHKKLAGFLILVLIAAGYYGYKNMTTTAAEIQYVSEAAAIGTISTSVSGTGQVSSSNQVDVKPSVSAKVVSISVKEGDTVKQGATLLTLDSGDAYKVVRDAQVNLQSARLSLSKLTAPADSLSRLQAENAVNAAEEAFTKLTVSQPIDFQKAEQNKQSQQDALAKAYEDALNTISSAYLNLPTIMSKLDSILYGTEIANTQTSIPPGSRNIDSLGNTVGPDYRSVLDLYATGADRDYQLARKKFDASFLDFKNTTRYEKPEKTESLLALNVDTIKAIAQAAKSAGNMFDKWVDLRTQQNYGTFQQVTTFQSNLNVYIGQANSALANILAAQKNIADTKQALLDATNTLSTLAQNNPRDLESAQNLLNEKKANFEKLAKGADTLDIQSAQLNVQKAQNSLYDASQKLADYTIKAPQDGVVAKLSVKVGDVVTSGTTVATFFAKQQIAEIALNEVDVAKVKNGQKATMTVEAVEGLEITGSVAQIDAIGAASQGVVSYTVKIILDTQDDRIRPGMSVSANILTNVKTDVLIVPGSAVKTRSANSAEGGGKYVQILNGAEVTQQSVITGLSNDTSVEIVSGLKEGDQVVTQTIDPSKATITTGTQRTGGSGIPGFGGGGGGGVMFRAIR